MAISNSEVLDAIDGHEMAGGRGYHPDVTLEDAERIVDNKAELLAMLDSDRDVIGVAESASIDLTGEESIDLGSKTLVSNRGEDGAAGGLIYTNSRGYYGSRPYTLFESHGSPRVSGLRLRGARHDADFTRWDYDDSLARAIMLRGPGGEVDNCELYGWTWNAVHVKGNGTRTRTEAEVHHNHIHKSYQLGYGYGVDVWRGFAHIYHNYFDECRHAVDGYGWWNCGYRLEDNIFGERQHSHQVDMHCLEENNANARVPDRDHKDFELRAGGVMIIRNNTFLADSFGSRPINAIAIRGEPWEYVEIDNNRFAHEGPPPRNAGNGNERWAYRQVNVLSNSWNVPTNGEGWTENFRVGENEYGIDGLDLGSSDGTTRRAFFAPREKFRAVAEALSSS